jgi:hypothetical protein
MCHCARTASCAKFCSRKTHLAFVCCRTNHYSALRSQASKNHCTTLDRRTHELPKYRGSVFLLASALFSVRNVSHGIVKASSPLSVSTGTQRLAPYREGERSSLVDTTATLWLWNGLKKYFCGDWRLYSFWGPLWEEEYKIMYKSE